MLTIKLRDCVLRGVSVALMAVTIGAQTSYAGPYEQAQDYFTEGKYNSALIELKNQLQEQPNHAQARLLLARIYLQRGDASAAEKELVKARKLGLANNETLLLLARVHLALGRNEEVIAEIVPEQLDESAQKAEGFGLLGQAYLARQQLYDARMMFDKSVALDGNDIAALGLAVIAFLEGEKESSLSQLDRLLARSPDNMDARFRKGQVLTAMKDYKGAVQTFSEVIAQRETHLSAYLARAEAHMRLGQLELARSDAEQVLLANPDQPQANFIIARLNLQAGDYPGAQAAAEKVLRMMPNHLLSFFVLGSAYYAQSNFEQAHYYLNKFVLVQPSHLVAARLLGATYLGLNDPASAIELLEPLEQNNEHQDAQLLNVLGWAYLQTGEYEKGTDTLSRAIAIKPDLKGARTRIALAELAGGDVNQAISQLQAAEEQGDSSIIGNVLLVRSLLKNQDYAKAEKAVTSATTKYPKSGVFFNLQGVVFDAQGKTAAATAAYKKALKVDPEYTPALLSLARQQAKDNNLPAAHDYYEKALKISPAHLQAHLALAQIELQQGDEQAYMARLEKARKLNPEVIAPVVYMVDYHVRNQQMDKALREARTFQAAHPESEQALSLLARVQIAGKEMDAARKTLLRIIDNNPRDVAHRLRLAQLLVAEKDYGEALDWLDQILKLDQRNMAASVLKFEVHVRNKEFAKAEAVVAKIAEAYPDSAADERLLGDLHSAQDDLASALSNYRAAYQQVKTPYLVNAIAGINARLQDWDSAITLLKDYLAIYKDDNLTRLRLANIYQQQGDEAAAIGEYEILHKAVPDNFMVLNNLSWLYWTSNDNRALEVARQAYELHPGRAEVADTYGWIMLHKGDKKQALDIIQTAASLSPENPSILYHRAMALSGNGKNQEAVLQLKKLLRDHGSFAESDAANRLLDELE